MPSLFGTPKEEPADAGPEQPKADSSPTKGLSAAIEEQRSGSIPAPRQGLEALVWQLQADLDQVQATLRKITAFCDDAKAGIEALYQKI